MSNKQTHTNQLTKVGRVWSLTVFPKDENEIWPANGYPETLNNCVEKLLQTPETELAYSENYTKHPWCIEDMSVRTPQGGVIIFQSERCPDTGKLHYQIGIRMAKPSRGGYIRR